MTIKRRLCSLRPVDLITFLFLSLLTLITVFFYKKIPNPYLLIGLYSVIAATLMLLIFSKNRYKHGLLKHTYDIIFPTIAVLLIFDSLGGLVHYINPRDWDIELIRLDYMIFGTYPTIAMENIATPLLTEVLQFSYATYYFIPVVLGIVLKIQGKTEEFERALFLIITCFYLSYIGYILMPAIGPRFVMKHLQTTELNGILIADGIRVALDALEGIKRDAFPSGHTAIALLSLYLAFIYVRKLFYIYLPIVTGLVIATVYCRYHYGVDVIAGILLMIFTAYFGRRYYEAWIREKEGLT